MKARVKATGEIWTFSQIDEITFKSAINGHLYYAEELEFIEPSVFSPDYWERLKHQYAGMAMQGLVTRGGVLGSSVQEIARDIAEISCEVATALVDKLKEKSNVDFLER